MSTTCQDVLNIVYALGNELDDNGLPNDSVSTEMENRAPYIVNMLQNELIKNGDLYSTYEISNYPVSNLLGDKSGFDIKEYVGDEITIECEGSAVAYYFEVDSDCTVYIEDYTSGWNTLATQTIVTTTGTFVGYKNVVTPTSGATKSRFRLGGSYRYLFTNYALFDTPMLSADIPDYRQFIEKEMPSDFKTVDQILEESPVQAYSKSGDYKWEGKNKLYIDYFYEGNIRIVYRPIPTTIDDLTDTLQIDDVTARTVLPYGLAMELYKYDEVKFSYFRDRYRELKGLSMVKQPSSEQQQVNIYF